MTTHYQVFVTDKDAANKKIENWWVCTQNTVQVNPIFLHENEAKINNLRLQ